MQQSQEAAHKLGLAENQIAAARNGTGTDAKTADLISFALAVYRTPSSITDADVDRLRQHGFSNREIADVVGVVTLNVMTGAFNLVAGIGVGVVAAPGAVPTDTATAKRDPSKMPQAPSRTVRRSPLARTDVSSLDGHREGGGT